MDHLKPLTKQFRPPAFPGSYFLSFEGIEGAGKSTQIIKTKDYLEDKGFRVIILREPGGTVFGEQLRKAILGSNQDIHPAAEMHLFASSRAQLHHEVTLKELAVPGTIVIYDRYIDSTLTYQGIARKIGFEAILKTHQIFPLSLSPHLTFYLKIDLETSKHRQKMRNAPKDYFESKGDDFYQSLIDGYDQCAELFPNRIITINATGTSEDVDGQIKNHLEQLIHQAP